MGAIKTNIGDFVVIEGGASGADLLSKCVAQEDYDLQVIEFPADWKTYGRGAGPVRNHQMLTEGRADGVVAFHKDIENSRGTGDMVKQARRAAVPTWICTDGPTHLMDFIIEVRRRKTEVVKWKNRFQFTY